MKRADVRVMALMAKGRDEAAEGRFDKAIAYFDQALARDPQCAQGVLYRAGLKLANRDATAAVEDFRLMGTLDHSVLPAYRDLTTLSAEEHPILLTETDRALQLAPELPWAHVFRAFSLRSLMQYDAAVSALKTAVALAPKSAALWAMLSRVKLTNRQDFYDGVRDMEKAVALGADWGWLHCWLGEARRHQGQFEQAKRDLDRGLALDPHYLRGYAWRGGVLCGLGRHEQAIGDLTRALAWDPIYSYDFEYTADQKSWAYNQRMAAYRALGRWKQALWDMNRAHRYGPRYLWAFNPKGDPKVFERALDELNRAIAAHPGSASAYAWRGRTLLQCGRPEEAVAALDAALKRDEESALALAWGGLALRTLGSLPQAEDFLSRSIRHDDGYAPAFGWRGELRAERGDFAGAVEDLSRAIALDHRWSWAFALRGECRRRMGDILTAKKDIDRALAIHPDNVEAQDYKTRLPVRQTSGAKVLA